MPAVSRRMLWTLYFVVFVDIFQVSFIFPLLPKIVEELMPKTTPGLLGTPAAMIGLLAGVSAGAEGLAAPPLGRLADRIGRRPVFLVAQVGSIISSVFVGVSVNYYMLLAGRVVGGVCGGTAGIAAAYIADVTTEEERPGYMTFYMAAIFAGFSVGPVVGGYLSIWGGWRVACHTAAAVSALNLLCIALFLRDSGGRRATADGDAREGGPAEAAARGRLGRCCGCRRSLPLGAWLICTANLLASVGWTVFETLGVIYVQSSFFSGRADSRDLATSFYSQLLSGAGVVGLVVNLFLYARVQRCVGLKGSIALGGLLKAAGYWGIASPWLGKWAVFAAVQVVVLGDQLQDTSIQTLITCIVEPTRFGEAMGQMTLFGNIARTVGPFAFSPIYEGGEKTVPWVANIFASLVAIALCLLARPPAAVEAAQASGTSGPPADEEVPAATMVRHLSNQTGHAMLFSGQAALVREMSAEQRLTRAKSVTVRGSRADPEALHPALLRSASVR